jgi:thymidylate kinase
MKIILIEGCDNLGKNVLIEGLCKHFNYDNVMIRHFGKPPEGRSFKDWQIYAFIEESFVLDRIKLNEKSTHRYFENIVIWNRTHIGELVWSPLYRNVNEEEIKEVLTHFENAIFMNDEFMDSVYLIYLYADPEFLVNKEDGLSFSSKVEQKQNELKLFDQAIEFSSLKNKISIKVNNGKKFKNKDEILKEVISFISK